MLDIRDRLAIVVGGSSLAAEKAAALVASGAHVRMISPEFCAELLKMEEQEQVTLWRKAYQPGDLAEAFVVMAITTDQSTIEAIWRETRQRNQPVNIADVPRYCTFILPSVLRRGQLTVTVSTEGASPSLAKRIRQQLEDFFAPSYETYIELAALARTYLRQHGVSYAERDAFFRDFMSSPILVLLDEGDILCALVHTSELLRVYGIEVSIKELKSEFAKELEHVVCEV